MFGKLAAAQLAKLEIEQQISEYTTALRALAKVIEDKELGDSYLARLDAFSDKPGFLDAIRSILKLSDRARTPPEIKTLIQLGKRMDLTGYSNALASIHTTLRRMKESGEVEEVTNDKGEKAYRLVKKGGIPPPPQASRTFRKL